MPSPHTRAFALFILSVSCARAAVADHTCRLASVAALIYKMAFLSRTNMFLKQRSAAPASAKDASDPRFRPTPSATNPDPR